MKIVNLTQHDATPEQIEAGVVELESKEKKTVIELLTFKTIPTREELVNRGEWISYYAQCAGADAAMIGGAPYLMSILEKCLIERGVKPLYAFSVRESVEEALPGGSVKKTNVFKHIGFVKV